MAAKSYLIDTQTDALTRLNDNVFRFVEEKEAAAAKQNKTMLIIAGVMSLFLAATVILYVTRK